MIRQFTYQGQLIRFEINNPDDHLQKFWLKNTFYELGMLQFIQARWQERAKTENLSFIDVGACIGNHSIFFSKIIGAFVHCIEPVPENCELIRRNMELNGVSSHDHFIWEFAASDHPGYLQMARDQSGNSGMHKISKEGDLKVGCSTIDYMRFLPINGREKIQLMKIDVEGHNLPVLRSAIETIEQCKPEIYIECQTKEELQEVEDFLLPLGYFRWPTHFNATPTYFFYYH